MRSKLSSYLLLRSPQFAPSELLNSFSTWRKKENEGDACRSPFRDVTPPHGTWEAPLVKAILCKLTDRMQGYRLSTGKAGNPEPAGAPEKLTSQSKPQWPHAPRPPYTTAGDLQWQQCQCQGNLPKGPHVNQCCRSRIMSPVIDRLIGLVWLPWWLFGSRGHWIWGP